MSRKRGWKKPSKTTYVGRPSKWGNPWVVKKCEGGWYVTRVGGGPSVGVWTEKRDAAEFAVGLYAHWFDHHPDAEPLRAALPTLRGRNLGCWCPLDQPCHADVLIRAAKALAHPEGGSRP